MTDKLFDSFIKDKLGNYQSKVPEGLWEKIEQKEKDRKPVVFWWKNYSLVIGLFIAFGTFGVGYLVTKSSSKTEKEITKKSISDEQQIFANNINKEKKVTNELLKTTENNTSDNDFNNTNKDLATLNSTNEVNDKKEIETILSTNNLKNVKATLKAEKRVSKSTKNKNEKEFDQDDDEKENNFISNKSTSIFNTKKSVVSKEKNKSLNLLYDKKQKDLLLENNNSKKADFDIFSKYGNLNYSIVTSELNILNVAYNENVNKIDLGNLFGKGDECPSARGPRRNDFYLEAYASPDFTFKSVISSKSGIDAYIARKDSIEVMSGGFTIGARISKNINNNLLFKAGLQYSQVNEKFTLKTENEKRETIVILTHTVVRPGLTDTIYKDTSVRIEYGYRLQSNMNYYKNFELPISLSYEMDYNRNWRFALNGGAILNLTSWYEGRTIDSRNNLINISPKTNSSYYKQKIGLSVFASVSVIRRVSDKIEIFVEPYYRFGLSNLEGNDGFNKKFNALGLQIGTRMRLSKGLGF